MKQWEGVQANGLPTPVVNILKRVVGFTVATITTDNLKVNATALANTPATDELIEPVRIVNEELDALMVHNNITTLARELARNAAVDGDGCLFTYWDPDVDLGGGTKGLPKTEVVQNTRVTFGNPNDRNVQRQPYIQIASREICRNVKIKAKANGSPDWEAIIPDHEETLAEDSVKYTDDKVTVLLTMWRDDETGEIWAYESTQNAEIREPWSLGIRRYPLVWLNWDYVQDCYHGQAMITGLIPNQIFINKALAMSMVSMMRSAWPKIVYDSTRVAKWDNRVGGAIGVQGDVNSVAKILDPAQISPQIAQYIQMVIEETEESLGATASALGEGKAYNTSAILSLQKAAATPNEMTKQNLYRALEEQFYIYVEFMAEYYGERTVDMPTPDEVRQVYEFLGQTPPATIPQDFDFGFLKENPMMLKLDVGASSYYSEIASMQTLDALLQSGQITIVEYLERIPDSYIPGRMALAEAKREEMRQQELMQQAMMGMAPPEMGGAEPIAGDGTPLAAQLDSEPEITGGRGYHTAARAINGGA